ncbi:hypothetical protein [Blastococcus sp. VKM Ac-2987]|uniref:hypothetical protein n=1 Tax=Blastococcus sp. VKM Ac-2987 TaxID=3004141 RepID=UPI0022ABB1AE|nr:hypothetical protein [Blastococcus sp. VKM Ac-2987]MCZ2857422.1 hypothetical protein [Blastococcus sp. VKM Ac-2987]
MDEEGPWRPLTLEEAHELGWYARADGCGHVTRAYDEWQLTSRDQRAYLHLTLRWMEERFQAEWRAILESPGHEDSPDPIDIFEDHIGMSPGDWHWMTLAAVVRDAVTAYEVYVIKAYAEVCNAHGHPRSLDGSFPQFRKVREACRLLGIEARPLAVHEIFELRNILTHQRGQLRTADERLRFSEDDGFWSYVAHLDEAKVLRCLDVLAAGIRDIDPVLWSYSWGGELAPPLLSA